MGFRSNGIYIFSANTDQTLTTAMQEVIFTGNGTGTYTYTLPELDSVGILGSKAWPGYSVTIRNAGSANCTLTVAKHANDTGIYLGSPTAVTSFVVPVGASVRLTANVAGDYWYLTDGTNFFDQHDDLEMLTSARAASTNSAALTDIGTGVEAWQFQPSTTGAGANKWLMGQRQITHGWDKQPVFWHVHFSPVTDLVATGTGIVVTWTMVWRVVHPGQNIAWANQTNVVMTYSLPTGTMAAANNYNSSNGGNDTATTLSIAAASAMVMARLELTSITNNGVNQATEARLNGWDAHMKLRRRGTVVPWPEP